MFRAIIGSFIVKGFDAMTKEKLESVFDECRKNGVPICVAVKLPDMKENELIINPPDNFDKKIEYYRNNYDDNLRHKNGSGVEIVDALPIEFCLNEPYEEE